MDGEENNQDALQGTGQPSGEGTQSPSAIPPKTYTEEEHKMIIAQRHSKLDTQIVQLEGERDSLKQSNQDTMSELQELQNRIDEIESEKVRDDPVGLQRYQQGRLAREKDTTLKRREADVVREEAKNKATLEAARAVLRDNTVIKLATKYGLDAKLLDKEYIPTDQLEDYAQTLKGAKPKPPEVPGGGEPSGGGEPKWPDSGMTLGGSGKLTEEQIEGMTPEQYAEHPSVKNRFK